jgi:hypothetical protein
MAKLTIPSLQHLARNWRDDPDLVRRSLVGLARNPPQISYASLNGAISDLLVLGVPYEQVEEGIRRAIRHPASRNGVLEILPLLCDHFDTLTPDFPPHLVARRFYPVARDLLIPFQPPLFYAIGGQRYLPWFSYWRGGSLEGRRLSLFVTLAHEMMLQNPELDAARFHIVDFSIPKGEQQRKLRIIEGANVPLLSDADKRHMLDVWAEGFRRAQAELASDSAATKKPAAEENTVSPGQDDLFPESRP